eukprot:SAG31_NODE_1195_length_9445_cov_21.712711_3_plen_70_part_00
MLEFESVSARDLAHELVDGQMHGLTKLKLKRITRARVIDGSRSDHSGTTVGSDGAATDSDVSNISLIDG